jgi:hypothetical protein
LAEALYRAALAAGDPVGWRGLADLRSDQRRVTEREQVLRDAITAGDPDAHVRRTAADRLR